MASLDSGSGVPWHRVVNARGEISRRADWGSDDLQRILLESEGVAFDECGRISVRRFGWKPRKRGTDPN
jgi:methylated-DNA-protein-cysteine methyltransferase-like protein